jgi:hypothetical protein
MTCVPAGAPSSEEPLELVDEVESSVPDVPVDEVLDDALEWFESATA